MSYCHVSVQCLLILVFRGGCAVLPRLCTVSSHISIDMQRVFLYKMLLLCKPSNGKKPKEGVSFGECWHKDIKPFVGIGMFLAKCHVSPFYLKFNLAIRLF